ncbi:hypothetical protein ACP4OV_005504 [Aristida adscensionis]
MADSEAPAPALPRAPPATKAARAAAALRRLLPVLAEGALLCTGGALWLLHAANATAIATRWACGEGSTALAVANKAARGAFLAVGVLYLLFGPLVFWKIDRPRAQSGSGVTRVPSAQGYRPATANGALPRQDGGQGPSVLVSLILVFCSMVVCVGLLIEMLALANCSCLATIGAWFRDIGGLGVSVISCYALLPNYFVPLRALQG